VEDLLQHDAVTAAVSADTLGHLHAVGGAVHGKDPDVFAAETGQRAAGIGGALLLAGDEGAANRLYGLNFDASAVAGDGGAVALPGAVGEQRVAENYAVAIACRDAHGVLGGDVVAEDVAVAQVTAVGLGIQVEAAQRFVGFEADGERVGGGGFLAGVAVVAVAFAARGRVFASVEEQVTLGVDGTGDRVDPPVDQVKVVGGLVHEQAAGLVFFAMPAAEVVGAVAGIQHPGKVDVARAADRALHDQLAHGGCKRRVAVVECHAQRAAGPLDRVEDLAGLGVIGGHGLFGDGVAAQLHGAADVVVMRGVHGGDDDDVRPGFGYHAVEVAGVVGGQGVRAALPDLAVVPVHARLAEVTERDQLIPPCEVAEDGVNVHSGAAAGTDEREAALGRRHGSVPFRECAQFSCISGKFLPDFLCKCTVMFTLSNVNLRF